MPKSQFITTDAKSGQQTTHTVVLSQNDTGFSVTLDDAVFETNIDITERHAKSVHGLIRSSQHTQPFCAALQDNGDTQRFHVWLNGHTFWLEKTNPNPQRSQGGAGGSKGGNIKAPMPGTVLKVLVTEGQTVEANQAIVIMESMKMEMTLSAGAASTVGKITCQPNQLVGMNDVLVELTPLPKEA